MPETVGLDLIYQRSPQSKVTKTTKMTKTHYEQSSNSNYTRTVTKSAIITSNELVQPWLAEHNYSRECNENKESNKELTQAETNEILDSWMSSQDENSEKVIEREIPFSLTETYENLFEKDLQLKEFIHSSKSRLSQGSSSFNYAQELSKGAVAADQNQFVYMNTTSQVKDDVKMKSSLKLATSGTLHSRKNQIQIISNIMISPANVQAQSNDGPDNSKPQKQQLKPELVIYEIVVGKDFPLIKEDIEEASSHPMLFQSTGSKTIQQTGTPNVIKFPAQLNVLIDSSNIRAVKTERKTNCAWPNCTKENMSPMLASCSNTSFRVPEIPVKTVGTEQKVNVTKIN